MKRKINYHTLFFFAFFLLFSIQTIMAAETRLVIFSSDLNTDNFHLIVEDDPSIRQIKTFHLDSYKGPVFHKRETVPIEKFITEGVTLPRKGQFVFARITAQNFDKTLGGEIVMDTLYNALTGKRVSYYYQMAQDRSGWGLFHKGARTNHIKAIANRVPIIGPVGVKELQMY